MSLAKELLQKVKEAKQAEDEMSIPTYDDLKTPNNHVANSSNATKERKVTGLGDRVEKKPTADIGTPHNEKGRKMSEADMQVPNNRSENPGMNPIQALGIYTDGGLLHFNHPNAEDQVYSIEYNQEIHDFLQNTLRRTGDAGQVFDLLHQWYEEGEGHDPQNMVGLNASKGHNPNGLPPAPPTRNPHEPGREPVREGANPIQAALNMHDEGKFIRLTSPDGTTGMLVPKSQPLSKAVNAFLTSPDARADTQAAAAKLFQLMGTKVQGVQAAEPEQVQAAGKQASSYSQAAGGGGIDTSGLSLTPMESKGHKTADGEMKKPTIKSGVPAKTAKVRGKQNDEPKNKGNPGSSKEEKGQEKKQFTVSPKDYKGGENEHKSMKKMHETIRQLESLLGRPLNKVREAAHGTLDSGPLKKPRTLKRLLSMLDKMVQPEGFGEKPFQHGNERLSITGDYVTLQLYDGMPRDEFMNVSEHPIARKIQKAGFQVQDGKQPGTIEIAVGR